MHIGPLPPPAQLAEYEGAHPGAAQWIFEEASKGAAHAREMELRAIKIQRLDVLLHRGLPFALVIAFLVASIIIAFTNPTAGAAGLLATVAGVLTAYLTGRTSVSRDRRGTPPPGSQRADGSKGLSLNNRIGRIESGWRQRRNERIHKGE